MLDAAGAERAHFVGISLGGLTGMWLGIHAPDRVGRLVLANTGAKIGTPDTWNQRISAVQTEGLEAIADSVLARWFTPGFAASHPDIVATIRHTLITTPPSGYIACCEALREADLRNQIAAIRSPVLVVTGTHDLSTPPALGEFVRNRIEGAAAGRAALCAHLERGAGGCIQPRPAGLLLRLRLDPDGRQRTEGRRHGRAPAGAGRGARRARVAGRARAEPRNSRT